MRIGANYAAHDSFTLTLTTPARGTLLLYRGMCIGAGQSCEHEDACERVWGAGTESLVSPKGVEVA